MKKIVNTAIIVTLFSLGSIAIAGQQASQVATVPSVDLDRYTGKWYEIAKYPNKFQKDCYANTTATYTKKSDGKLEVTNECMEQAGTTKKAVGEAKISDKASNAKLKVRFAPGFLSFLPFVWGDYWVVDLASDYRYSVVGEPSRKYLWILSRTPEMAEADYQAAVRKAESMGYLPTRLEKTPQNVQAVKGAAVR